MEKPKGGWALKRDSASKLTVWFEDGNIRTFYSMDWRSKHARHKDTQLGLNRLKALVAKFGNKVKTAIIYEIAKGRPLYKYQSGEPVPEAVNNEEKKHNKQ